MSTHTGFRLLTTSPETGARVGELLTGHGVVATPVFIPVGTQATVKALSPDDLKALDVELVMANTYHLYLRPGIDTIKKLGGLHSFMGWDRALITDSGGYQVFSLNGLRKVTDEGVIFNSHIDGSRHLLTPELAIQYQESLGADLILVLDECAPPTSTHRQVHQAMKRTHHWAERCLDAKTRPDQSLFAIVQGGIFPELRRQSADFLTNHDFAGYALGGLSIGEPKTTMHDIVQETVPLLPAAKPRYLMGLGTPDDIVNTVASGIDIFDSALPTQVARKGALFTRQGRQNIRKASYRQQDTAFDPDCTCYTCRNFSAAYLHHLFRSQELLIYRLATIHNLHFMARLMKDIQAAIRNGDFASFRDEFLAAYEPTDDEVRLTQKQKWLTSQKGLNSGGTTPLETEA